jgi:hypothetical protein
MFLSSVVLCGNRSRPRIARPPDFWRLLDRRRSTTLPLRLPVEDSRYRNERCEGSFLRGLGFVARICLSDGVSGLS